MKKLFVLFVLFSVSAGTVLAKNPDSKPRVIVMTDGEILINGSPVKKFEGINVIGENEGYFILETGSGDYHFNLVGTYKIIKQ